MAQGFLAEGLQRTTAGLGSVIIDSQPLTVALLATLLLGEPFSRSSGLGLVVGAAGLCLLELPPDSLTSLPAQLSGAPAPTASFAHTLHEHCWQGGMCGSQPLSLAGMGPMTTAACSCGFICTSRASHAGTMGYGLSVHPISG